MVAPIVLKRRHTLKDTNILPVVRRMRTGQPDSLKEFARISKDMKTESLSFDEVDDHVTNLTGGSVGEVLMMAGRDDKSVAEARWALHCVVLYANEFGQPKGQDLTQSNPITDSGKDSKSGTTSNSSTTSNSDTTSNSGTTNNQVTGPKRKRDDDDDIKDRIASLEKVTSCTKEEVVKDLKEKVRTLCLQVDPSHALILLTLDELAKVSRRLSHEETELYEELARQASRFQAKLDITSLCLSVLGGKAADLITKAVSKCLKTEKSEAKKNDLDPQPEIRLYIIFINHTRHLLISLSLLEHILEVFRRGVAVEEGQITQLVLEWLAIFVAASSI